MNIGCDKKMGGWQVTRFLCMHWWQWLLDAPTGFPTVRNLGKKIRVPSMSWSLLGATLATASFDAPVGIYCRCRHPESLFRLSIGYGRKPNGGWNMLAHWGEHGSECKNVEYLQAGHFRLPLSRIRLAGSGEVSTPSSSCLERDGSGHDWFIAQCFRMAGSSACYRNYETHSKCEIHGIASRRRPYLIRTISYITNW
jgi:hypothetical protein